MLNDKKDDLLSLAHTHTNTLFIVIFSQFIKPLNDFHKILSHKFNKCSRSLMF